MKISKRHLAKTFSWRLVGTIDTILISWFISNSYLVGVTIGSLELITKLILYYAHERLWFKSRFKEARKRHIYKTFSWRLIGTFDTIILGWIFTGNPTTGLKIGFAEIITKMILYYTHEKIWYRIDYGLDTLKRSYFNVDKNQNSN